MTAAVIEFPLHRLDPERSPKLRAVDQAVDRLIERLADRKNSSAAVLQFRKGATDDSAPD